MKACSFLVMKAVLLTGNNISRETAVRGLDIERLLAILPQQLVTEHLDVLLDLAL